MTNKDFFDKEFYTFMIKDFEDIRARRNALKGKPTQEELAVIKLERLFESFYRKFF